MSAADAMPEPRLAPAPWARPAPARKSAGFRVVGSPSSSPPGPGSRAPPHQECRPGSRARHLTREHVC